MKALSLFESLISIPHVGYVCGPSHPTTPDSEWSNALDDYFRVYPELSQDPCFKEFMYICPEFYLPAPEEPEDDLEKDDYESISACPLVDEGFMEYVEEGFWIFADCMKRFKPYEMVGDEDIGLAGFRFALHCSDGRCLGIYCKIGHPKNLECDWVPYIHDFCSWLTILIERKGHFLKFDEGGNPML